VGEPESFSVTVNVEAPAAVGVPEMTPVVVFRLKPEGSVPWVTEKV
jgi:hypothetical protein